MCGIAAIFAYGVAPPVEQEELLRIRDAMANRGPDGAGVWISEDQRIGMAHRRLAIIDLSAAGDQPMSTQDGSLQIVFNGEIYNYQSLRRELEGEGCHFRTTSDTEVLLHLYARRGVDMVHALRGMYAFAIWDDRKKGLFLARDQFGIKPLYYSIQGGTIRVASQVKALLKSNEIDTTPAPAGHVGFFLWGHVPEPYTLYKNIRALPAGSSLRIDKSGHKEFRQFFNIANELTKVSSVTHTVSHSDMLEQLQSALLDSVRHHLIADVPVGVFLSAGLDSTTLAALARDAGVDKLQTVTLGFGEFAGTRNDEVPLAEQVARHYSTRHQTRWVTKEDFQSEYHHLLDVMDQPTVDGVNMYFVSKAAKEAGLKVALSGVGGDELFGGYSSFQDIPKMVKMFKPFRAIPAFGKGFRYIAAPILKHFTSPKYAGLLEFGGTVGGAYLLRRGFYMPWELPNVLDADLVRQGWQELQTMKCLSQTTEGFSNLRTKVTALETAWYMRNQLLRDTDWAGMAHSLEIRVPLVDIELFRAVSPWFNSSIIPSKLLMAKASSIPLPREILNRVKTGFSIPVQKWLHGMKDGVKEMRGIRGWAKYVYRNTYTVKH